jgi:hypothetical protein
MFKCFKTLSKKTVSKLSLLVTNTIKGLIRPIETVSVREIINIKKKIIKIPLFSLKLK